MGGSLTHIDEGFAAVDFVPDQSVFMRIGGRDLGGASDQGFSPGTFKSFEVDIPVEVSNRINLRTMPPSIGRPPSGEIYFFGFILYSDTREDMAASQYISVFRRVYNSMTRQFDRTGNPDHEYAD